jgi:hypothetical protein
MFFLSEFENFLRQCKEIGLWLFSFHTIGDREYWSAGVFR